MQDDWPGASAPGTQAVTTEPAGALYADLASDVQKYDDGDLTLKGLQRAVLDACARHGWPVE